MALSKIDAANFLTGTIPQGNVANASLGAVTALPGAIPTGKVLQVVGGTSTTQVGVTANSYTDTGLTANITPASTSNKVLIIIQQSIGKGAANTWTDVKLQRAGTDIAHMKSLTYNGAAQANYIGAGSGFSYLDSPSSTSALTYKTVFRNVTGTGTVNAQVDGGISMITLLEIAG